MFHRMQIYNVYVKPDRVGEVKDVVFVREGFNFLAFALSIFWALFQRAWLLALLCFMFMLVVQQLEAAAMLHPLSISILQLGLMVIVGFLANDALGDSLKRRGYKLSGTVVGENKTRAEMRFFDQYSKVPA